MSQRKVLNNGYVKVIDVLSNGITHFRVRCPVYLFLDFVNFGGTFSIISKNHTEFYTPSFFRDHTELNFSDKICNELTTKFQNFHIWLYNFYRKLVDFGMSPTQVRMLLPQSTFIEFSWTLNVSSLPTSVVQFELNEYFDAMRTLTK